ncbi:MAG: septation ring formation regulator EzrA [Erysipelotrichaceae bacterium]|nr:septation ring formation regulator EzrA [Erysipelotrichaceae bacterium]
MTDQTKLILIGVLVVAVAIIVAIIYFNTRKANLRKDIDDLNVRFNEIKTVPLAFKLNKAQAMAKRNEQTAEEVKVYYQKYEDAQKHIDQITEMIENIEDSIAGRNYKEAREALSIVLENINDSEKEVNAIDKFLEQFAEEENNQRENSARLKESFRELKLYIHSNAAALSIALEGIEKKVEVIEDLFSQSEEFMYINEYLSSQECLMKIEDSIKELRLTVSKLPEVLTDTKGVVPTLLDEVSRQYALTRQRGVHTEHLKIDSKLEQIKKVLNEDVRTLSHGDIGDTIKHNEEIKNELNELLASLERENEDFQALKVVSDKIANLMNETRGLNAYVAGAYKKDKERFGLEDMESFLSETDAKVKAYQAEYIALNQDIAANDKAASVLKAQSDELITKIEEDKTVLSKYKATFDKNTTDEQRAKTQLMKLQVVLNEVEVKVLEYHLPTIANSYHDDLIRGREKIAQIKSELKEIPIDIEKLNKTLDDTIDFIYKFYNNVNNVVGMAIMVENAIVFGNKYRSSFPEVERDLSKAEFSYINGEYTKALTMAISCMEKLFPNRKETDYLENV